MSSSHLFDVSLHLFHLSSILRDPALKQHLLFPHLTLMPLLLLDQLLTESLHTLLIVSSHAIYNYGVLFFSILDLLGMGGFELGFQWLNFVWLGRSEPVKLKLKLMVLSSQFTQAIRVSLAIYWPVHWVLPLECWLFLVLSWALLAWIGLLAVLACLILIINLRSIFLGQFFRADIFKLYFVDLFLINNF